MNMKQMDMTNKNKLTMSVSQCIKEKRIYYVCLSLL